MVVLAIALSGCSIRIVTDHPPGPKDGYYEYQLWVHHRWDMTFEVVRKELKNHPGVVEDSDPLLETRMIEWRSLPGYPQYEVSEYGAIRRTVAASQFDAGYVMKPQLNRGGYLVYDLINDDAEFVKLLAHRAVALAFHGSPPAEKPLALHMDDIKLHNHHSNLYWGTYAENTADADKNGRILHGADHPQATLTHDDVENIRADHIPGVFGYKRIAKKYGISPDKAKSIILRRSYKTFEV